MGQFGKRTSANCPHLLLQGVRYYEHTKEELKMRTFKHLTRTKRLMLEEFLKNKVDKKEIAKYLNVHLSTIYREVKRGAYKHLIGSTWEEETRYSCDKAHNRYLENLKNKGADIKLGKDFSYAEYLEKRVIEDKLSPLAVLGEIKAKGLKFNTSICVNTFYKYIERGVFYRLSIKHLPLKEKRKKHNRKLVIKRAPKGTSIEQRPLEILERKTFGHWEMDCVCGSTKSTLLVLTERLTRKEIIMQMQDQKAKSVINCLNIIERKFGKNFKKIFKTITVDNGSEFSDCFSLEKSIYGKYSKRTKLYYCHPYCSCERGIKRLISLLIRSFVPRSQLQ